MWQTLDWNVMRKPAETGKRPVGLRWDGASERNMLRLEKFVLDLKQWYLSYGMHLEPKE